MTDKTVLVLHGYFQLSAPERQEFVEELNKYLTERETNTKKSIEFNNDRAATRITSGPISSGCACCGR